MGLKKKIIIVLSIVIIWTIVISIFVFRHQKELSLQLPDNNGADKSLCLITKDMIENYNYDYRTIKRSVVSKNEHQSGVKGKLEEFDNEYSKTKIRYLSGIYIGNAFLGNGKEVSYTVDSTVYEGNFLMVITDENDYILYEIPIDQEFQISFVAENEKMYYLKFVGESAHIEVEISRQFDE